MTKHRGAMWVGVAGVSLLTPWVLSVVAKRFPTSPIATFNTYLHTAEA